MSKFIEDKKGIALITIYVIIAVLTVFITAYTARSFNELRIAQIEKDKLRARYAAEAGIAEAAMNIYIAFQTSPQWNSTRDITGFQQWFVDAPSPFFTFVNSHFPLGGNIDDCQYSVIVPQGSATNPVAVMTGTEALVKLIGVGTVPHRGSTIREVVAMTVSYGMGPSPVFNYAYFINNFGWMSGGSITVNGDMRSNGNFSFSGDPRVNGDIYASVNPGLAALGTISGNTRNWNIDDYQGYVSNRARPTDPTDPSNPQGTIYEAGYDGESQRHERQTPLTMPYLGDLNAYKQLAIAESGQIRQGAAVLVDHVYNGPGPDGTIGTPDDKCMVLIGTAANPIVIDGPVVIEKDVIIKGVVKGQGTIYAGRNTHIIGNITYQNSPSWPKPDPNPSATDAVNNTRDFLGLACKGNIVIGNYTTTSWYNAVSQYIQPPFTQGYDTDADDALLGYDSDSNPTNGYHFNGNYTALDGGTKSNGSGGSTPRKFYESSLSNNFINANSAPTNQITRLDAIVYNNHAITGRTGSLSMNGSIVSRDEAIVGTGNLIMNYDTRAYSTGVETIHTYLPLDLTLPRIRTTQNG